MTRHYGFHEDTHPVLFRGIKGELQVTKEPPFEYGLVTIHKYDIPPRHELRDVCPDQQWYSFTVYCRLNDESIEYIGTEESS